MRTIEDLRPDALWIARSRGADIPAGDIVLGKFYVTFFAGDDPQIEAALLGRLELGADTGSIFLLTTSRLILLHGLVAASWSLASVEAPLEVLSRSTSLQFGANWLGVRAGSQGELRNFCRLANDLRILQPMGPARARRPRQNAPA